MKVHPREQVLRVCAMAYLDLDWTLLISVFFQSVACWFINHAPAASITLSPYLMPFNKPSVKSVSVLDVFYSEGGSDFVKQCMENRCEKEGPAGGAEGLKRWKEERQAAWDDLSPEQQAHFEKLQVETNAQWNEPPLKAQIRECVWLFIYHLADNC